MRVKPTSKQKVIFIAGLLIIVILLLYSQPAQAFDNYAPVNADNVTMANYWFTNDYNLYGSNQEGWAAVTARNSIANYYIVLEQNRLIEENTQAIKENSDLLREYLSKCQENSSFNDSSKSVSSKPTEYVTDTSNGAVRSCKVDTIPTGQNGSVTQFERCA